MEEVLLRFPDLGEAIFDSLDGKSLHKCRKVGKAWKHFIENPKQKFLWIQIIRKHENDSYIKNYIRGPVNWSKLKINDLREFARNLDEETPEGAFGHTSKRRKEDISLKKEKMLLGKYIKLKVELNATGSKISESFLNNAKWVPSIDVEGFFQGGGVKLDPLEC